jgi:NAD(P)-dependent dehydrogenase (short-subunit alcohol dehydrogenase family)
VDFDMDAVTPHAARGATGLLANKVVTVFGAGRTDEGATIGATTALAYAAAGGTVICVDRDIAAAERTAGDARAVGGTANAVTADVSDLAALEALAAEILREHGRVDVMHNNVGAVVMGGPVELAEADFERAVSLNLGSVYRTAKAFIPAMLEGGGGAIVNTSSLAAIRWTGYPYFAYSAAKAAVNQATVAIAMEYARQGIRANCVIPGAIDSPLIYRQIASNYASREAMQADRAAMVPLGFMGQPEDVAAASVFLASDLARFITGVCLPVDGGQSCAVRPLG